MFVFNLELSFNTLLTSEKFFSDMTSHRFWMIQVYHEDNLSKQLVEHSSKKIFAISKLAHFSVPKIIFVREDAWDFFRSFDPPSNKRIKTFTYCITDRQHKQNENRRDTPASVLLLLKLLSLLLS